MKTPLRVVRQRSEMLSKVSPWPDKATNDDLTLVEGKDAGNVLFSEPPAFIRVKGSVSSSVLICWSTKVFT